MNPPILIDAKVCAKCKHWRSIPNHPENRGRCYGAPPSAVVVPHPSGQLMDITVWPSTSPDEFCGSFSPRVLLP